MPKVNEAHLEKRRMQILEAAFYCFARNGFHGSTMRDICRRSGLSPGAVYSYFRGKEEIIEALAAMGRDNTRKFVEQTPTPADAPGRLSGLVRTFVEVFDRPASRPSLRLDMRLWGEAMQNSRIRRLFLLGARDAVGPFESIVRVGQSRDEINPELDPEATARVLLALFLGLQVQKAMDPKLELEPCALAIESLLQGSFGRKEPA